MVSPRPNEETSSGGDTVASQETGVGSNTIPAVTTAHSGPILTPHQPETPRPTTMGTSGQYIPNFTVPVYRTLGMPTDFPASMHNTSSIFGETPSSSFPRYHGLGPLANQFGRPPGLGLSSQSIPTFTSSSIVVMRHQMDESNHEMAHMLTQQMGIILRPLIQDSTQSYQQLETQMTRIENFLGAPRAQVRQTPPPPPRSETPVRHEEIVDKTIEQEYHEVEPIPRVA